LEGTGARSKEGVAGYKRQSATSRKKNTYRTGIAVKTERLESMLIYSASHRIFWGFK
jgi:hypothetical protein